jgi:hypothetical protein
MKTPDLKPIVADRVSCIHRIEEIGYNEFAIEMAENKWQTIKRK